MPGLIRAVVDTSILVRAFLKPQGTVGPILDRLIEGRYVLIYSRLLLDELIDVLHRPRLRLKYSLRQEDIEALVKLLLLLGDAAEPARRIGSLPRPKDDKVLEAAVEGIGHLAVFDDKLVEWLHAIECLLRSPGGAGEPAEGGGWGGSGAGGGGVGGAGGVGVGEL